MGNVGLHRPAGDEETLAAHAVGQTDAQSETPTAFAGWLGLIRLLADAVIVNPDDQILNGTAPADDS